MSKLKEEFIELLDKDREFRYTVAGYLGLSEILKRLDRLEEGQNKLWEGQEKLWEEVKLLREGQNKLWEGQEKLWEEVKLLREGQNKLWEGQEKLWEEVRDIRITQNRIATTIDRLTISVEEEGLYVIRHRLENELGLKVELRRIFVGDKEINIYGATDDICIIGEATVRLGINLIHELEEKIEILKRMKPELIRSKIVKVIYADYATPAAVKLARERGIWVLSWKEDATPRIVSETS